MESGRGRDDLVGMTAWTEGGDEIGRIVDLVTDEGSGKVTHVVVERESGERLEVPRAAVSADEDADFATFHADRSDAEPGEHVEDEVEPQPYAPSESDVQDQPHEGQFVTEPQDPDEAQSGEDLVRESGEAGGWEDESSNPPDSGYPRNDVYVNPDTGEEESDPAFVDNQSIEDDVSDLLELLEDNELAVASEKDGVVELTGSVASQADLDTVVGEILGLEGVLDVDTTDVEVGD